jgi:hypothetical protein
MRGSMPCKIQELTPNSFTLPDGHFEHPGVLTSSEPFDKVSAVIHAYTEFFCSLLDDWGHREVKSLPAWKFRMPLFYPFVIKTQENNEIVVQNSVMASQAIIKSA